MSLPLQKSNTVMESLFGNKQPAPDPNETLKAKMKDLCKGFTSDNNLNANIEQAIESIFGGMATNQAYAQYVNNMANKKDDIQWLYSFLYVLAQNISGNQQVPLSDKVTRALYQQIPSKQPIASNQRQLESLVVTTFGIPMIYMGHRALSTLLDDNASQEDKLKSAKIIGAELKNQCCEPLKKIFGHFYSPKNIVKAMIAADEIDTTLYTRRPLLVSGENVDKLNRGEALSVQPIRVSTLVEGTAQKGNPLMEAAMPDALNEAALDRFKGIYSMFKPKQPSHLMPEITVRPELIFGFYRGVDINAEPKVYQAYLGNEKPACHPYVIYVPSGNEDIQISNEPLVNGNYIVNDMFGQRNYRYFVTEDYKNKIFTLG